LLYLKTYLTLILRENCRLLLKYWIRSASLGTGDALNSYAAINTVAFKDCNESTVLSLIASLVHGLRHRYI